MNLADALLTALGLMLVIEGLLPFAAPEKWKELFQKMTELPINQIRTMGLTSIVIGLILIWIFV